MNSGHKRLFGIFNAPQPTPTDSIIRESVSGDAWQMELTEKKWDGSRGDDKWKPEIRIEKYSLDFSGFCVIYVVNANAQWVLKSVKSI